jgi:hypothetical protein
MLKKKEFKLSIPLLESNIEYTYDIDPKDLKIDDFTQEFII